MEEIPPVRDYVEQNLSDPTMGWGAQKLMREFAKLHLQAQKEAIIKALERKNGPLNVSTYNMIMNTYPPENIK